MPDYLFTPGVDLSQVTAGLTQFENQVTQSVGQVTQANTRLQNSFNNTTRNIQQNAGRAGEALNNLSRVAQDAPFGFIAISNNLNPLLESFQRLRAESGSTGAALRALGSSLAGAGGIGFALSAITAAISFAQVGFQAYQGRVAASKKAVEEATKANKEYVESLNTIAKSYLQGALDAQKELIAVQSLYEATQNDTLSRKDRNEAVDELQKKYPGLFENYTNEEILVGKAAGAYNTLKTSILEAARARAASSLLEENFKSQIIQQNMLNELKTEQLTIEAKIGNVDTRRGDGLGGNTGVGKTLKLNQDLLENKNKQAEIQDKINELQKASIDINNQVVRSQQRGGIVAPGAKTQAELEAEEQAKKDKAAREKAEKEREQQEKAFQALLLKLQQDTRESQAKAIDDEEKRSIEASDASFKNKLENAQKEVKLFEGTAAERRQLSDALKTFETANEEEAGRARQAIQKKYSDERLKLSEKAAADNLKLQTNAEKALASIGEDTTDRQIVRIKEKYRKIYEAVAAASMDTNENLMAIDQALNDEIANVNIAAGQKEIAAKERTELRKIDLDTKYAGKAIAIQKQKELDKLNIQLEAAEKNLALLQLNGKKEEDVLVQNASDLVDALKKRIQATQRGTGETLFQFLGIGTNVQDDINRYSKAAEAAGKVTGNFLNAIADGYQRQIDARKAAVDADDKALADLETRLDKEKALRDQGVANNYTQLQQELADKKKQREEDQKNLEDIQKRQNAAKKAQIIADSVAQVSNLITASSEIFAAFSAIPFVGVPLAIAAIGVMFGAFAAAKINALKAVGTQQTFKKGGFVDGKPHTQGGKKYYSNDGSGDVVELEGGEHVTNKDSSRRFSPLLEKINDNSLHLMGDDALRELLKGTGVRISEAPAKSVKIIREHTTYKQQAEARAAQVHKSEELRRIDENVQYMANKQRNDWQVTETDTHITRKKGGLTVNVRKK